MYGFVTWLCQPYTIILIALAYLMAQLWHRQPAARRHLRWMAIVWLLLAAMSTPAAAYLALKSLESPFPPIASARGPNDTIVVLTGGVDSADALRPRPELSDSSLYRCVEAARLYNDGPRCPVLVAGGKVNPAKPGACCSHVMRDFLLQLGLEAADLSVEDHSRSTYESAVACRPLLASGSTRQVLLVTDATHLRRAVACFAAQGIDVTPVGCHYEATHFDQNLRTFLPNTSALKKVHTAMHEWTGLAWYWVRGRL